MTRTEFNLLSKFAVLVIRLLVSKGVSPVLSIQISDFNNDLYEYGENEVPE